MTGLMLVIAILMVGIYILIFPTIRGLTSCMASTNQAMKDLDAERVRGLAKDKFCLEDKAIVNEFGGCLESVKKESKLKGSLYEKISLKTSNLQAKMVTLHKDYCDEK